MRKRKTYTKEFKEDAVKLLRSSGKPCTHVAKDLGISETALRKWNAKFDEDNPFPGKGNPRDKEIYELKKEIKNLKEEREILKKAMAIFSQEN
jgi:transposase